MGKLPAPSRGVVSGASYGHRCTRRSDGFVISWQYDVKYSGSRLRHPRGDSRYTSEKNARRFCKRWGIPFPEETTT